MTGLYKNYKFEKTHTHTGIACEDEDSDLGGTCMS